MGVEFSRRNDTQKKIKLQVSIVQQLARICQYFALSGGLAWHIMSVPHDESKNYHDHKDVDVIAFDSSVISALKAMGFVRQYTKYSNPKFARYTKYTNGTKITFDVFFERVPTITVDGIPVVHPKVLASFYRSDRWQKTLKYLSQNS